MAEVNAALLCTCRRLVVYMCASSPLQAGRPVGTSDMQTSRPAEVDPKPRPGMHRWISVSAIRVPGHLSPAGVTLRVVGGSRFRNKDEIPQTFLPFLKSSLDLSVHPVCVTIHVPRRQIHPTCLRRRISHERPRTTMASRANCTESRLILQIKAMPFLGRSQKMVPTSKVYVFETLNCKL